MPPAFFTDIYQASQKQNTQLATSQKWVSAADVILLSPTNGTSKPATLAMSGRSIDSRPYRRRPLAVHRRPHSRHRRARVRKAETRKGRRNGASSRCSHCWMMNEEDYTTFCILGICISIIIERCIVPPCKWNITALQCIGTSTLVLAVMGSCILSGREKRRKGAFWLPHVKRPSSISLVDFAN